MVFFTCPTRWHYPVCIVASNMYGVGAIGSMNLYPFVYADKTKNLITGNGITTLCENVIHLLAFVTDNYSVSHRGSFDLKLSNDLNLFKNINITAVLKRF